MGGDDTLIKQVKEPNTDKINVLFHKGKEGGNSSDGNIKPEASSSGSNLNPEAAPFIPGSGASNPSSTNPRPGTTRSTLSGTTFTDLSEIRSVSAPSRANSVTGHTAPSNSGSTRPRPFLPAVGTIGKLTYTELRALYISLHPYYVGSIGTDSEATLRTKAQDFASNMSEKELRESIRNIRHHGSYDSITNPRPVRVDTPPITSNAGPSSAPNSAASAVSDFSNSRSGR